MVNVESLTFYFPCKLCKFVKLCVYAEIFSAVTFPSSITVGMEVKNYTSKKISVIARKQNLSGCN